jgi:hypothetical protein
MLHGTPKGAGGFARKLVRSSEKPIIMVYAIGLGLNEGFVKKLWFTTQGLRDTVLPQIRTVKLFSSVWALNRR